MLLSFRVLFCFSSPCLETTRASLGWMSPPTPEVKPGIPQPMESGAPGQLASPFPLPKMNEANVMLPYSGKEEPVLPAPHDPDPLPPSSRGLRCGTAPTERETQFCQCNCLCFTSWSHSYAVPSF